MRPTDLPSHRPVLVYLHGFRSSPQSEKAVETGEWLAQHRPDIELIVPAINDLPDIAVPQLLALIQSLQSRPLGLIGSSMGGFFCAWLAAQFPLKVCLINPAVNIADTLQTYLGEHDNFYTGARFTITQNHVDLLRDCQQLMPPQSNIKMLLQTGDETLDYRQALDRFPEANTTVEQGGNHRFEGYIAQLPGIIDFLQL